MSKEIQRVNNVADKTYASPAQLKTIHDLIERMQGYGKNIAHLPPEQANMLTGGRDGTASILISDLIKMEKDAANEIQPTDSQLEEIVRMFYYPDADYETYGIEKKIWLDFYYEHKGETKQAHRFMEAEEFAQEVAKKMKRKDAFDFIYKHRAGFNEWRKTRATMGQIERIRQLEERLVNTAPKQSLGFQLMADGSMQEVFRPVERGTMQNPTGYTPIDEHRLLMMPRDIAHQFILQLEADVQNRIYNNNENIDILKYDNRTDFDVALRTLGDRVNLSRWDDNRGLGFVEATRMDEDDLSTILRSQKETYQAATSELVALNDLIFALEARVGCKNDELHVVPHQDIYTHTTMNDEFFSNKEKLGKIKDFMFEVLRDGWITYNVLARMCSRSLVAQELLIEVTHDISKDTYLARKVLIEV
jgi:hypothetical protein